MDRPDSVLEVVQGVLDEVGAAFSTASDLEKTIWAATSMDVHPPAKQDLTAIAAATHRSKDLPVVCSTLAQRLRDDHWRFVYKSLVVCEYCLENGSERFEYEMRKYMNTLRGLAKYKYIDDDGNDRGFDVRKQAKRFLAALEGDRERGSNNRGFGGSGGFGAKGYGDLDFDGDGGRDRSPARGPGRGVGRVVRPDYEKEGTGLFSDEDAEGAPSDRDEDERSRGRTSGGRARRPSGGEKDSGKTERSPPRSSTKHKTARSPPRRQVSGSAKTQQQQQHASARKPASKRGGPDTEELTSKLGAFSMADGSGASAGGVRSGSPAAMATQQKSLLDDDFGDDFGDFSAGPTPQFQPPITAQAAPLQPLSAQSSVPFQPVAAKPAAPFPMGTQPAVFQPMAPQSAPFQPMGAQGMPYRPMGAGPAPMQPMAARPAAPAALQPARTATSTQQQPRPMGAQAAAAPKTGGGFDSLVNLDAHALSKLGGQKRPEGPKKSAPLASMSSSSQTWGRP